MAAAVRAAARKTERARKYDGPGFGPIVVRKLDELKPNPKNPRVHDSSQIELLKRLIRQFGFTRPLLIDERSMLISGHGRVEAAHGLGMLDAPTQVVEGWSDEMKMAYTIADNRSGELSFWDRTLLRDELALLNSTDFPLDVTGFDLAMFAITGKNGQPIELQSSFEILISCESEEQQRRVLDQLTEQGLKCRALLS